MRSMTRRELSQTLRPGIGLAGFSSVQLAGDRPDDSQAPAILPGCSASWAVTQPGIALRSHPTNRMETIT
jgi:hypothetical protein